MKRLMLILAFCAIGLTACSSPKKSLEKMLLGTWANSEGYQIQFQKDGVGFVPGVKDKIPDSYFTYEVIDDSRIRVDFQGQSYTVEITITNNTLLWKDDIGVVTYTRKNEPSGE